MKPRLPAAPLTDEDYAIWLRTAWRFSPFAWTKHVDAWEAADRRDADLMFWAQRHRSYTFPVDLAPLVLLGLSGWIDCGGALAEWKTLNITYFA